MKNLLALISIIFCFAIVGCENTYTASSDEKQTEQQERILAEGTAQVGMPAINNFRERKLLKQILELRDQADFVTYTYIENAISHEVPGKTALGGKFTYLGVSIGYGIPYSTQFTSPQKIAYLGGGDKGYYAEVLPQADPNGLFSPESADGTWIMLKDPEGNVKPQYIEPKICTFTYKLPMD